MKKEIETKINSLIGQSLTEIEMRDSLEDLFGENYNISQFDSWIDNGLEEGLEDEYIYGAGFTITDKDGSETDIRIYYGNNTRTIFEVRL